MEGPFDAAARYLMKLRGDAVWERTAEPQRETYREKVRTVLRLVQEGKPMEQTTVSGTYCATCDSYTCEHAQMGN